MTDRSISFSASMIRAMLAGRKAQTRRLIRPQPPAIVTSAGVYSNSIEGHTNRWSWLSGDPQDLDTWEYEGDFKALAAIGDRLYVREAWRTHRAYDDLKPADMGGEESVWYEVDRDNCDAHGRYRYARFMPRWASRLTLIVEDVRVQRLQEISEADAIAEGIERIACDCADGVRRELWHGLPHVGTENPIEAYADLWDSLHNPRGLCADDEPSGWHSNPWIVAVTFSVVAQNIDNIGAAA